MKNSAEEPTDVRGAMEAASKPAGRRTRWRRWMLRLAAAAFLMLLAASGAVFFLFRASLPMLDGDLTIAGVPGEVTIERDELGVPTISASDRAGMIYGLGFVHGQDRFFQMDLSRRSAAGELAALLGEGLVNQDRWQRIRTSRDIARRSLERLNAAEREWVENYTRGVNAGLQSARVRPPEYFALRASPTAWAPEDALLVLLAMAFQLTDQPHDAFDYLMRRELGPAAFDFFYPQGTQWDTALDGTILGEAVIPGPELIDFRKGWPTGEPSDHWKRFALHGAEFDDDTLQPGSNGWAVDGKRSRTGSAMVAGDMHLGYSMPSTFYRTRLKWNEAGRAHDIIGVTLPGMPGVVAGSNGSVAWVATAAALDLVDLVAVEVDPNDTNRYKVPDGWAEFGTQNERIKVHGGEDVEYSIRTTVWGPIDDRRWDGQPIAHLGHPVAVQYVFHSPEALDFRLLDLTLATNAAATLAIAAEAGIPVVNVMAGDKSGNVGWIVAGRLPRRLEGRNKDITFSSSGGARWNGFLAPEDHPRAGSPELQRVLSGNQRKLGTGIYRDLIDSDPVLGARARQISEALEGLTNATEAEMLAIQLDDRALFLNQWRPLLESTLRNASDSGPLANCADVLEHMTKWSGRARPDEAGYRLLRAFRRRTIDYLSEPLMHKAAELTGASPGQPRFGLERPAWALIEQRPAHLLNPRFESYEDLFARAAADVVQHLRGLNNGDISRATWGQVANRPIQHPFSRMAPFLSRWLDASTIACSGGNEMPRVHGGGGGATERMVVSPGHENDGIFHMPGGQSGHFLSRFYRAGHEAWRRGEPAPLLPGKTKHVLKLKPVEQTGASTFSAG